MVAVLTSVVSLFYYINVVRIMMFNKRDDESRIYYGPALGFGIFISGIMVIVICVLPATFFEMASKAVKAFFPEL